jgi:hypothetical protein
MCGKRALEILRAVWGVGGRTMTQAEGAEVEAVANHKPYGVRGELAIETLGRIAGVLVDDIRPSLLGRARCEALVTERCDERDAQVAVYGVKGWDS